jgi:hypothetical protein
VGYQAVHEALESRGLIGSGGLGHIKCPAHDDARGSLSLKEGSDDKALVYCHAGCPAKEVVEALDLTEGDLFAASQGGFVVDQYVYENYAGEPIYRVTRLEPKGFYQERFEEGEWKPGMRDVPRYPYRLTDWKDATWVYITEGEKDADRLNDLGVPATTLVGGAGKWRDEYATWFADKTVTIIADNDEPGILGAQRIALGLNGTNGVTTTIKLPREGKDVSDHLDAGFDAGDFILFEQGLEDLEPLDWETYIGEDIRWLYKPYIPADGRVLAFGAAGSLKSLWAMWVAGRLSKEGKKVAYFSLEMRPSDTVRRIKQLHPNRENFKLFTKFNFRNPNQVMLVIDKLKGYDLIVIDSWTASHKGGNDNEEVAQLDTEVFQPIIDGTGASLLILDNTGHSTYSEDGEHKQEHPPRATRWRLHCGSTGRSRGTTTGPASQ